MNVYVDESGDMGYTNKSSRFFVLTCFCISEFENDKLEKDVKKYLSKLIRSNKKRIHYFHAYKESDKTKKDLINIINIYDYEVKYFVLEKNKYRKAYKDFILDSLSNINQKVNKITLSKYETRRSVNDELLNYSKNQNMEIKLTSQSILLQVADLFSWVIFQKIEKGNSEYFNLCKSFTKQNP